MKLIVGLSKRLGGLVLLLATAAIITGVSLFVIGGFLMTWPVLRMNPVTRRKQAIAQLTVSVLSVVQAFQPEPANDDEEDESVVMRTQSD